MNSINHSSVVAANVELHSGLAERYNEYEPHYRPENVAKVSSIIDELVVRTAAKRTLDLGCGTGFMIDILKTRVAHIDGVDVTEDMLERVDTDGPATIQLHRTDTEQFECENESYDLVTAYSFLHHLFDPLPTARLAARALRPGGIFYGDLDPNRDFWCALQDLAPEGDYSPVVARELAQIHYQDESMQNTYGVSREIFDRAEYGKNIRGGFTAQELTTWLRTAGFSEVHVRYHWFLGEAHVLNDSGVDSDNRLETARQISDSLVRALPLTQHLFKYVGFVAVK